MIVRFTIGLLLHLGKDLLYGSLDLTKVSEVVKVTLTTLQRHVNYQLIPH